MKLSGFGSRGFVRFFWFCSAVGLWARLIPWPHFHSPRRRADLSGAFFIVAVLDRSVLVVASDAPRPVEDGVGAVGIDVDLNPRLDEMRAHWLSGIWSLSVR